MKKILLALTIILSGNAYSVGSDGSDGQSIQICTKVGSDGSDNKVGSDGSDNKVGSDGSDNKVGSDGSDNKVGSDGSDGQLICQIISLQSNY